MIDSEFMLNFIYIGGSMVFGENDFMADQYMKFSDFDLLYEGFVDIIDYEDKINCCLGNKYLLSAIIGCIEGTIEINIKENSWHIWLGQHRASSKLDGNFESTYMLINIYQFIENHIGAYDFIFKYYNLWHKLDRNDNKEFMYDKYHIQYIQENYRQLMLMINIDIEKAKNIMDDYVFEMYKALYATLIRLFSNIK